ncbi:cadherin-like beta sandwich domain-containing protein [Paenibacillus chungangensis]|uniref:Cadherin-like beta sandwich domain-containing protein n=1 Tax=Paenibacillus chungangensis TaxID=696535 RepID=A0ABW3HUA8_9BACL
MTDLRVDGKPLTDFASGNTGPYLVSISHAQTSAAITQTTSDPNANVQLAGNTNLVVGENTINVTVTSQKGTTKVYSITVTRAAAPINNGGGGSTGGGNPSGGGSVPTPLITSTDGEITLPVDRDGELKLNDEVSVSIPSGATYQQLTLTIERL